jgi:hypothetical protein
MGSRLVPRKDCLDWNDPAGGSGEAFITALSQLGRASGHPELTEVPWALWGHSGGAGWVVRMTAAHPRRVLATVAKSLCQELAFPDAALGVPVVVLTGPKDFAGCLRASTDAFARQRARREPWGLVMEADGTHDAKDQRLLAIPYLDAAIAHRLPPGACAPVPVTADAGWLLTPDRDPAPARGFTGDLDTTSWLPDEASARRFAQFARTGRVDDISPPAAVPSHVRAIEDSGTVRLAWRARADLESGIGGFAVYRDGERIARVGGPEGGRTRGRFQYANYGDEPEPVDPAMAFTEENAPAGAHRYQIAVVNGAGLEGPRSAPVEVTVPMTVADR